MRKSLTLLAVSGAMVVSLTACGSNDSSTASSGSGAKAQAKPVAALASLKGKMTQVTVDPGFLKGVTGLGLKVGLVGTATLTNGVLSFPITGGDATYYAPGSRDPYVESNIKHEGSGISLTGGGTVVQLKNFTVDAGKSMLFGDVTANGAVAATQAPLFFLDGRTLKPLVVDKATNTGVLEGTQVSLTKAAADLLDKTYKTTALKEFFKVGVAKITLQLS